MQSKRDPGRTTLLITTIERPDLAERFLASVRDYHRDLPILLSEQCEGEGELREVCARFGAVHMALPYDCGLSHARNEMVRAIATDYFVLAEDDMILTGPLDVAFCERFLDEKRDFLAVTGALVDYEGDRSEENRKTRERELLITTEETSGGLVLIPADAIRSVEIEFEHERLVVCDYGPNWGVFRRDFFIAGDFWWDERFKTGGQHVDFFLRAKLDPRPSLIASWSKFVCDHVRDRRGDYEKLRTRLDWVDQFREKWGFRYTLTLGRSVRYWNDYANPEPLDTRERQEIKRLRERLGARAEAIEAVKEQKRQSSERILELKARIEEIKERERQTIERYKQLLASRDQKIEQLREKARANGAGPRDRPQAPSGLEGQDP